MEIPKAEEVDCYLCQWLSCWPCKKIKDVFPILQYLIPKLEFRCWKESQSRYSLDVPFPSLVLFCCQFYPAFYLHSLIFLPSELPFFQEFDRHCYGGLLARLGSQDEVGVTFCNRLKTELWKPLKDSCIHLISASKGWLRQLFLWASRTQSSTKSD